MTVPMDCVISYTAGSLFALSCGDMEDDDSELRALSALNRGRLFTLLVTVPIGLYYMIRWPDWEWMYLLGERGRSLPVRSLGPIGCLAAHEAGFRHASRLSVRGSRSRAIVYAVLSFFGFFVIAGSLWKRFRSLGTYREYRSGESRDFLTTPDAVIPLLAGISVFFLAAVALCFLNHLSR